MKSTKARSALLPLAALFALSAPAAEATAQTAARRPAAPPEVRDANERDDLQRALQQRVERSGGAWISTTVLGGRRALRANVNSFLTERRHVDDLVELLRRESSELLGGR